MKFFNPAILLFIMALPMIAWAQNKEEELLDWSETRKLTWADYKARPNPASDAAASTTTYLAIDYDISSRHFSYKIESRFSKSRSWGLHQTDYILSHEQGHFDIAEIFARKLHQEMSAYRFNERTYQKDLKKIYGEITKEKEEIQNQYDRETNHSINKAKQAEWLKKISIMLNELADYSDY